VQLVERENGDFAVTMARLLLLSTYLHELWSALRTSSDETLAAIAAKAVKEVDYHVDHARMWVLRLGDGTEESHARMQAGLEAVLDLDQAVAKDRSTRGRMGRSNPRWESARKRMRSSAAMCRS
jgi:ring-1,2-phenylacetyl-CoA epoxidase subunit PaaC